MQKIVELQLGDSTFQVTGDYKSPINNYIHGINEEEPIPAQFAITKIEAFLKNTCVDTKNNKPVHSYEYKDITEELYFLLNSVYSKKESSLFYTRLSELCLSKI